jgi:hypothetical protein
LIETLYLTYNQPYAADSDSKSAAALAVLNSARFAFREIE